MTKPHWRVITTDPDTGQDVDHGFGCQNDDCPNKATVQWQRAATTPEIDAEQGIQSQYGEVARNRQGIQSVAVFSCDTHALRPDLGAMHHRHDCAAPGATCECPVIPHGTGWVDDGDTIMCAHCPATFTVPGDAQDHRDAVHSFTPPAPQWPQA